MNKKDILCTIILGIIGFGSLLALLITSLMVVFF